ncbi:MAG: hydantoinase B/oxoprolinase family protein [Verrucomicrobiales bacterium]
MTDRLQHSRDRWLIAVDTGGTFIDAWAIDPSGKELRRKLLSSSTLRSTATKVVGRTITLAGNWDTGSGFFVGFTASTRAGGRCKVTAWEAASCALTLENELAVATGDTIELSSSEEAPVLAARLLTGTPMGTAFPQMELRLSTTRATNALLEHKGARVAFFTTEGFGDLLTIGDQRRPDLFALEHRKPPSLCAATFEVNGRIASDGTVLTPLDEVELARAANAARSAGCDSAAVAFVNSFRNPEHEERARTILSDAGFETLTLSSELSRRIKLLPRAQTSVVNAYLHPILEQFISNVASRIGGSQDLLAMSSSGALEPASTFRAKDSLFSGPAGGVIGAAAIARAAGLKRIITFDMGGTSTDVARWDGEFDYQTEQRIGDTTLVGTSMRIETVAAGGGSICSVKATGLSVGPESAGSLPGPACYGCGGPLTLTDVNLLLGRLDPEKVSIPLDRNAAQARLRELIEAMNAAGLPAPDSEQALLLGLLDIAIEHMTEAIRRISVRYGYDPADYALVAFGGAGPQHACAIADRLGIGTVIVPETAGILSACGVGAATAEHFAEEPFLAELSKIQDGLGAAVAKLEAQAVSNIAANGSVTGRFAELRLMGQESTVDVAFETPDQLSAAFVTEYARLYGYPPPESKAIELVAIRVRAAAGTDEPPVESFVGEQFECGPQILQDSFSTLYIASGWRAERGSRGSWKLTPESDHPDNVIIHSEAVSAELFRNRFYGIAEQMGVLLQRTAMSTNVKERLDFSCAILSGSGELVVNAPHIPVHLGALGECVRRCVAAQPLNDGDVLITNHPAFGGSHLPDVTVIAPLVIDGKVIAYCAARAHHSEIGGITPGSMPATATRLSQEGVVISPMLLMKAGRPRYDALRQLLEGAPFPTRSVDDNLADVHAQVAAVRNGLASLSALCSEHGPGVVVAQLNAITLQTGNVIASRLRLLPDARSHAVEIMDDGTRIEVALEKHAHTLTIHFSGTSRRHAQNLNATPAIVRSAILYVLRLMLQEALPLNEGLLRDVTIELPDCFLNPSFPPDPEQCPAVVGGNVETSQRLVDTLIKAFNLQACSQGTMNNVIFGDDRFGYYETLCGGAGAGPGYAGADGLHTHMTNTAITDVEVLEHRYPVRLLRFAIRPDSGGRGQFNDGNGIVRHYQFLKPVTVSLLTEHRNSGPFGLEGGHPGRPGAQWLVTHHGTVTPLPPKASIDAAAGDCLIVETPGGGGFGKPKGRAHR